jgi:hypothetical protein
MNDKNLKLKIQRLQGKSTDGSEKEYKTVRLYDFKMMGLSSLLPPQPETDCYQQQ